MNSIGFKNFRRFKNMDPIRLGGVNFFVGGNNAGKSTVVKAMLLVANFLKNPGGTVLQPKFPLNIEGNNIIHIHNFANAANRDAVNSGDRTMSFRATLGRFEIEVNVYDVYPSGGLIDVDNVVVKDNQNGITFTLMFKSSHINVLFESKESIESTISNIKDKLAKIYADIQCTQKDFKKNNPDADVRHEFFKQGDLFERLASLNSEKKKWESLLDKYEHVLKDEESVDVPVSDNPDDGRYIVSKWLHEVGKIMGRNINDIDLRKTTAKEAIDIQQVLNNHLPSVHTLSYIIYDLEKEIDNINLEYLSAHSAPQQTLFLKNNENDYVARSLQEFVESKIAEGTDERNLLKGWLQEFGIAEDVQITSVLSGEGYEVNLDGKPLSEFGRGSIQLIVLFIRLATIIKKHKNGNVIVLVEEPEQNLHPAAQSKLADLFYEAFNFSNGSIQFIIETHSEYMVRHVQVIALKQILEDKVSADTINSNLTVSYFTQDCEIRDMIFQETSRFKESFDEGFFDQAARESLMLARLERQYKED